MWPRARLAAMPGSITAEELSSARFADNFTVLCDAGIESWSERNCFGAAGRWRPRMGWLQCSENLSTSDQRHIDSQIGQAIIHCPFMGSGTFVI
jgi:hypothetical protein